jgi:subtilisin family serine protease
MTISYGYTWDARRLLALRRALVASLLVIMAASMLAVGHRAWIAPSAAVPVIVRELPGARVSAEQAVTAAGGTIGRRLEIINGFAAEVPAQALPLLQRSPAIHSISSNRTVHMLGNTSNTSTSTTTIDPALMEFYLQSMYLTTAMTGAQNMWRAGYTGKGVDVAIVDSGVVPLPELQGHLINGPDLSFESRIDSLRHLDTFGHGTHLAGIIAGKEPGLTTFDSKTWKQPTVFLGMAPDARIVNVKVGARSGATDVSQVIAAIDWVVQHRNTDGLNIRVLNLSFGTDGVQSYRIDPLAYAAEVAWRKGIVVVAAAGNAGYGTAKLNNPAYDPYVIAVGASDFNGTFEFDNDIVAGFSSKGDSARHVDLVAPGRSIRSLRDVGSYVDDTYPVGRVDGRFTRGSGTSQAAAIVSGAAALLIQQRPGLKPDEVKALLTRSAYPLPAADAVAQGHGFLSVWAAQTSAKSILAATDLVQTWPVSTGEGTLDGARGTAKVAEADAILSGEQDARGVVWDGTKWAAEAWAETSWAGDTWEGKTWTGNTWTGNTWSGNTWTGNTWTGNTWTGNTWTGNTWAGNTWSATSWSAFFGEP